jgi:plasmid stability protein
MADLTLRDVPAELAGKLARRAARSGRSPEEEALALIAAALGKADRDAGALAASIRGKLAGRAHSDSAELLARDRGR